MEFTWYEPRDEQKTECVMESVRKERAEYRQQLAQILLCARHYCGTEAEYRGIFDMLIKFEGWLRRYLIDDARSFDEDVERDNNRLFHPNNTSRTIGDILTFMHGRFEKACARQDEQALDVVTVELEGVILPPGQTIRQYGKAGEEKEIRFENRLGEVIGILNRKGIYTDDVIVCRGYVTDNMMREDSYHLIEIPRLRKQILVCDQVGEATFVIDGILPRETLLKSSKEELQGQYGPRVTRIVKTDASKYEEELEEALRLDSIRAKIDVRKTEALRAAIMKEVKDAETWAGMMQKECCAFKIGGLGICAIATKFGVKGYPASITRDHLKLGRAIFGELPKS